jgi:solute carrier family 8 (sodium/calcium exchanger)
MLGPTLDEDNLIVEDIDAYEAFSHFCAIGWKVIFALVPPTAKGGGMPAFFVSLMFIGMLTMVVGEFATVLGCVLGIEESVAAITLVALGTSLPDTFASMTAAQNSADADAAIGNITGSNSVNVFLGLGLPWMIGSIYFQNKFNGQKPYVVPAGVLAFSVAVFLGVAILCFIVLICRRCVSTIYHLIFICSYFSSLEESLADQQHPNMQADVSFSSFGSSTSYCRRCRPTILFRWGMH